MSRGKFHQQFKAPAFRIPTLAAPASLSPHQAAQAVLWGKFDPVKDDAEKKALREAAIAEFKKNNPGPFHIEIEDKWIDSTTRKRDTQITTKVIGDTKSTSEEDSSITMASSQPIVNLPQATVVQAGEFVETVASSHYLFAQEGRPVVKLPGMKSALAASPRIMDDILEVTGQEMPIELGQNKPPTAAIELPYQTCLPAVIEQVFKSDADMLKPKAKSPMSVTPDEWMACRPAVKNYGLPTKTSHSPKKQTTKARSVSPVAQSFKVNNSPMKQAVPQVASPIVQTSNTTEAKLEATLIKATVEKKLNADAFQAYLRKTSEEKKSAANSAKSDTSDKLEQDNLWESKAENEKHDAIKTMDSEQYKATELCIPTPPESCNGFESLSAAVADKTEVPVTDLVAASGNGSDDGCTSDTRDIATVGLGASSFSNHVTEVISTTSNAQETSVQETKKPRYLPIAFVSGGTTIPTAEPLIKDDEHDSVLDSKSSEKPQSLKLTDNWGRPLSKAVLQDGQVVGGSAAAIGHESKGHAMICKMGYTVGRGLGSTGTGMLQPVTQTIRTGKGGLGSGGAALPVAVDDDNQFPVLTDDLGLDPEENARWDMTIQDLPPPTAAELRAAKIAKNQKKNAKNAAKQAAKSKEEYALKQYEKARDLELPNWMDAFVLLTREGNKHRYFSGCTKPIVHLRSEFPRGHEFGPLN